MPDALTAQARDAVRLLRRMPAELRAELAGHVKAQVAGPLAGKVRAAAHGPYAPRVTVTVVGGVEPALRVGGGRKVFSGGATGRDVFYGNEWGGGRSRTWYRSSRGGHAFAVHRATRAQFRTARPFVLPTFAANYEPVSQAWIEVLDPLLDAWTAGGAHG